MGRHHYHYNRKFTEAIKLKSGFDFDYICGCSLIEFNHRKKLIYDLNGIYRQILMQAGLAGGIYRRYLPPVFTGKYVHTGMDNTSKSGVYRHLLAFINISLISLQIILLTVLATHYIVHGHHSKILQHMYSGYIVEFFNL